MKNYWFIRIFKNHFDYLNKHINPNLYANEHFDRFLVPFSMAKRYGCFEACPESGDPQLNESELFRILKGSPTLKGYEIQIRQTYDLWGALFADLKNKG